MLTRRLFCGCVATGLAAGFATSTTQAAPAECAVMTPARRDAIDPDQAIARLQAGNARFFGGATSTISSSSKPATSSLRMAR